MTDSRRHASHLLPQQMKIPIGPAILQEAQLQPDITAQATAIGQRWGQRLGADIETQGRDRAKSEAAAVGARQASSEYRFRLDTFAIGLFCNPPHV